MLAALTLLAVGAPQVVNCASQADAQIRAAVFSVERGARIVTCAGSSMLPLIGKQALVLVSDRPFTEVTERAVVVRKDEPCTCHRAIRRVGERWVMKGDNALRVDKVRLDANNFGGVVIAIFNFPKP